jgi:hypothetical protein
MVHPAGHVANLNLRLAAGSAGQLSGADCGRTRAQNSGQRVVGSNPTGGSKSVANTRLFCAQIVHFGGFRRDGAVWCHPDRNHDRFSSSLSALAPLRGAPARCCEHLSGVVLCEGDCDPSLGFCLVAAIRFDAVRDDESFSMSR